MSHSPERVEKICLNCGASLHGRYCHVCGQENLEPKENLGHLLRHFLEDVTHFDGKFFSTIKYLIVKPGFLPQEYLAGRRARYLHPIRMYLFISFIFFFVFATFFVPHIPSGTNRTVTNGDTTVDLFGGKTSAPANNKTYKVPHRNITLQQYEAEQDSLPPGKRDGMLSRYLQRKYLAAGEAAVKDPTEFKHRFLEKFFHSIPQMLFVLLPLFALILQLLYIRHKKEYGYVAHAIFTTHFYCFVFIAWFFILLFSTIQQIKGVTTTLLFLSIYVYLYIAMLKFYKQGWFKTLVKYFVLNGLVTILIAFVSVLYVINALLNAGG